MRPRDVYPRCKFLREMRGAQLQQRRDMLAAEAQREQFNAMLGQALNQPLAQQINAWPHFIGTRASDPRTAQLQRALTSAQRTAAVFGFGCVVLCLLLIAR